MATETLTSSILSYLDHGAYPSDETVASSSLVPKDVSELSSQLRSAQDEIKEEIRAVSKSAAPDIDTWIARAKSVQLDIQQSRDTARQIVAEAEASKELRAKAEDAGQKIVLLEKEVAFNEALTGTLDQVQYANGLLDEVLNAVVRGDIEAAMRSLNRVGTSIEALVGMGTSRVYDVLRKRAEVMKGNILETTIARWDDLLHVDDEQRCIVVGADNMPATNKRAVVSAVHLSDLVQIAQALDSYEPLLLKLNKDLERVILGPRLAIDKDDRITKITVQDRKLFSVERWEDKSHAALYQDLGVVFEFLASNLPTSICVPLSELLVPSLMARLEDNWLNDDVLMRVKDLHEFQELISSTLDLANSIDKFGWHRADQIRIWAQDAPKLWLKQQRESLLDAVRNYVFIYSRETKIVEKVETQLLNQDDALVGGSGTATRQALEEGDWDSAWDEPEDGPTAQSDDASLSRNEAAEDDDDDASAWDLDEDEIQEDNAQKLGVEDDAWGWGDGDEDGTSRQQPAQTSVNGLGDPSPVQSARQQEITLRESYTITSIPTRLLELLDSTIKENKAHFGLSEFQIGSGPLYESGVFGPGPPAYLSLPNLMFAIYRATAPIAYTKVPVSNMLMYNDASHLVSELRGWQDHMPDVRSMRLDNEIKNLESFAKHAYAAEMEAQRTILRDLVDGAQGFSNATVVPYKQEGESAIDQTVERLCEMHRAWKGILSNGALLQSMGALVSTVTSKMMSDIQDLPDIGEEDSKQLKLLCDKVSAVRDFFSQDREGESMDMTFVYTPNWLKFQYLAEILESSLADIKYLWNEGELALEFSKEEVVELLEALFADSDLRRKAVSDIRRSGRGA
nr:centromere/kinetochore protein zw10 like [Quercus suber]